MHLHSNEKFTIQDQVFDNHNDSLTWQSVADLVKLAALPIAPLWPLNTFIARNPLQGFESQPFEKAITEAELLWNQYSSEDEVINRETIKWCAAFFDQGQSTISMPHRDQGFYGMFRELAPHDGALHQKNREKKRWLSLCPSKAEDAILRCLDAWSLNQDASVRFLSKSLALLPGWSGYILKSSIWKKNEDEKLLIDYLAIRLSIGFMFHENLKTKNSPIQAFNPTMNRNILDSIYQREEKYKNQILIPLLNSAKNMNHAKKSKSSVQLVFCIDVRSEPFRRQLELLGSYETFGFAGFFGLPIRVHDFNTNQISDSCPVLLEPQHDIYDEPDSHAKTPIAKHLRGKKLIHFLETIYQNLKYNFATSFSLVETAGLWCGLFMLARTLKPNESSSFFKLFTDLITPRCSTRPMLTENSDQVHSGIPFEKQITYAETALRMMGLTKDFSPMIIFCGHGSTTTNNPYASSLDCGACGAHPGGANAKVLTAILNQAKIRQALVFKGLIIPDETQFFAAEHNTTTDDFDLFINPHEPIRHPKILEKLKFDLIKNQNKTASLRQKYFDATTKIDPVAELKHRSEDWSELRAEWGLARCASFIIAPRQLTQQINLNGRSFLHSYDWTSDKESSALESILTAPLLVAQMISAQYLFSTIDPIHYSSGSKTTQNIIGKIGVMQGNSSDLMHGLPLQSIYANDSLPFHPAQRLLTLIYAPKSSVAEIIHRHQNLKDLFYHAWIHLIVIDPLDHRAYQFENNGSWSLIIEPGVMARSLDTAHKARYVSEKSVFKH